MTEFDVEAAKRARRERIENRPAGPTPPEATTSPFVEGERMTCPLDGADMVFGKGLTHLGRVQQGLLVVANLAAFVCQRCGERSYDPPSLAAIQEAMARELPGMGIRAKLSKLARKNIGVYLPQDLQRHLEVEAGDMLVLQPVGRDFILAQIERKGRASSAAPQTIRRYVLATEMFTTEAGGVTISGLEVVEDESPEEARIEGQQERPTIKRSDRRRRHATEIRTDEDVPADSPTAGMTLIYGGE